MKIRRMTLLQLLCNLNGIHTKIIIAYLQGKYKNQEKDKQITLGGRQGTVQVAEECEGVAVGDWMVNVQGKKKERMGSVSEVTYPLHREDQTIDEL